MLHRFVCKNRKCDYQKEMYALDSTYKLKDRTPCTFCSYKPVCQFDESMEENHYRLLVPRSKEQALELMKKEVSSDDGE